MKSSGEAAISSARARPGTVSKALKMAKKGGEKRSNGTAPERNAALWYCIDQPRRSWAKRRNAMAKHGGAPLWKCGACRSIGKAADSNGDERKGKAGRRSGIGWKRRESKCWGYDMDRREKDCCGGCVNGRRAGGDGIWCRLFGIMIRRGHEGCKSFDGGDRDAAEGSAAGAGVAGG